MQTLTYGRKRPDNGDRGSSFFTALRDNITLEDSHSHNGTDSPLLKTSGLVHGKVTVSNADWVENGDGFYYKLVTLPTGWQIGSCQISFFVNSGDLAGQQIQPKWERVSSTQLKLFMPRNDLAIDVLFT